MNKKELEKALDVEFKKANDNVSRLKNEINKAQSDLEYWSRQSDALSTVRIRLSIENSRE